MNECLHRGQELDKVACVHMPNLAAAEQGTLQTLQNSSSLCAYFLLHARLQSWVIAHNAVACVRQRSVLDQNLPVCVHRWWLYSSWPGYFKRPAYCCSVRVRYTRSAING